MTVTGVLEQRPRTYLPSDERLIVEFEDLMRSTATVVEEREALMAYLRSEYEIRETSVLTFLRANSDLAWLLVSAKPAIKAAFGVPVRIFLDMTQDPTAETKVQELFGYIASPLPLERALEALSRFDESWFLDNLHVMGNRLNFDLLF